MSKPTTEAEWCLERAKLSATVGLNKLQEESMRETPSPTQFALFSLLHAVRELAGYFREVEKAKTDI